MTKVAMMVAVALLAGGCAADEKPTVVRESSIARQFAQLNKNGWNVTSAEMTEQKAAQPKRDMRVVKEADFSGLMFRTNFQIDDPKLKEEQAKREKEEAAKGQPSSSPTSPLILPPGWK
jgi:hypothetical protein